MVEYVGEKSPVSVVRLWYGRVGGCADGGCGGRRSYLS